MRVFHSLACALSLGSASLVSATEPPWGTVQDGLSCRVIAASDYTIGEPVSVRVEIRNTSDKTRYLYRRFDKDSRALKLDVKTPDNASLRPQDGDDTPPTHKLWQPIKPHEIWNFDIPVLSAHFVYDSFTHWQGAFHRAGEYRFQFSYRPPDLENRMIVSHSIEGKKRIPNFKETPKEILEAAWHGTLTAPPTTLRIVAESDLAVHEWGVFTVYNGVELANVDRKAEWSTLPEEFYRQFPKDKARLQWIPSAWDKPIIYFHTTRPALRFRASVNFGEGAPVVWWPAVAKPIDITGGRRPPVPDVPLFRELEWHGWLGDRIPAGEFQGGPKPLQPEFASFPKDHWLSHAREVPKASTVTVAGTNLNGTAPWTAARIESEKFLYYDGLVPAPDYLRCTASGDGSITLKNSAKFDIGPLFIADHRNAKSRGAIIDSIPSGSETKVDLTPDHTPQSLAEKLTAEIENAGLLNSESESILTIWNEGLFNRPGITATYLLPRAEYDRMLPLKIEPKPQSTVRVGIVRQPNIEAEPALTALAKALIANLRADDQKTRIKATRALIDLGPVAIRLIKETLAGNPDPETALLCHRILSQIDASDYLPD